jgi:hypothetical protein
MRDLEREQEMSLEFTARFIDVEVREAHVMWTGTCDEYVVDRGR